MAEKKKINKKLTAAAILLLFGNLLLFLTIWLIQKYDHVYFDQLLFQLKAPSAGVQGDLASSAVMRVGVFGVGSTMIEILLYRFLSGRMQGKDSGSRTSASGRLSKAYRFFMKRTLPLALAMFVFCLTVFMSRFDVIAYVDTLATESDFIEEHYADPNAAALTFPEEKRNLIYIFLESMENTFGDTTAGGSIQADYISELTALADQNISFSHTSGIGGAYSYSGTTWTAAAMVTQTSGVPVKVEITADAYGTEEGFLPGVVSLGEILQAQGYQQTLLVGSDAEFHGRESYFTQHGDYEIIDLESLRADGRLPEDYWEWWGYEDEKLFEFAKQELTRLAEEDQPFNFTMLTADTHFPDGYLCPQCGDAYEEQYANVLACSAKQVAAFVEWIQAQPFYEDTTIVISGDHLTMDPEFLEDIDENYTRTIYNCIINAPTQPVQEKNRAFATFDMFPTTLAAMGVEIEGDRLGLGTNLFSSRETLTEQYGFTVLDDELQKNSEFYNTVFLEMGDGVPPRTEGIYQKKAMRK